MWHLVYIGEYGLIPNNHLAIVFQIPGLIKVVDKSVDIGLKIGEKPLIDVSLCPLSDIWHYHQPKINRQKRSTYFFLCLIRFRSILNVILSNALSFFLPFELFCLFLWLFRKSLLHLLCFTLPSQPCHRMSIVTFYHSKYAKCYLLSTNLQNILRSENLPSRQLPCPSLWRPHSQRGGRSRQRWCPLERRSQSPQWISSLGVPQSILSQIHYRKICPNLWQYLHCRLCQKGLRLGGLLKTRQVDASFRVQILSRTAKICQEPCEQDGSQVADKSEFELCGYFSIRTNIDNIGGLQYIYLSTVHPNCFIKWGDLNHIIQIPPRATYEYFRTINRTILVNVSIEA